MSFSISLRSIAGARTISALVLSYGIIFAEALLPTVPGWTLVLTRAVWAVLSSERISLSFELRSLAEA